MSGAYPIEESESIELEDARVVSCPDWALGPGASLRCGLAALGESADAALVVLADGPYLDPRAVERVLAHRDQADFVAATYDGTRSHPAVISRPSGTRSPTTAAAGSTSC